MSTACAAVAAAASAMAVERCFAFMVSPFCLQGWLRVPVGVGRPALAGPAWGPGCPDAGKSFSRATRSFSGVQVGVGGVERRASVQRHGAAFLVEEMGSGFV